MHNDQDFQMGLARVKSQIRTALADVNFRNGHDSNRCNNCSINVYPLPVLLNNGLAGVDRIKVGIPIDSQVSDWQAFLSNLKKSPIGVHGRAVKVKDKNSGVTMEFFVWPGPNTSVIYLEFNPSRYRDPNGYSLVHPNEIKSILTEVIQTYFSNGLAVPTFMINANGVIDKLNWNPSWKSEITLSRLDASIDFRITDPYFSPILLSGIRAKYSHGTYIAYNDGQANSWSNILKSQDGRMTFYNKHEQTKKVGINQVAPLGSYRFEYRMELRHLSRNHIHTLADLSEDRFEAALRSGWNLSNLSLPLIKEGGWKELIRGSALANQEKAELIGFLEEDDLGNDLMFPDQYRKQMRAKARSIGITFKKNLEDQSQTIFKLDIDSGDLIEE